MFVFQGDSKYVDKARKLLLTTEVPTNDCSRVQASDISESAESVEPTATTAKVPTNDRVQVSGISKSAGSVKPTATTAKVPTNDRVQVSDISENAGRVEPTTAEVPTRVLASKNAITVKPTITLTQRL